MTASRRLRPAALVVAVVVGVLAAVGARWLGVPELLGYAVVIPFAVCSVLALWPNRGRPAADRADERPFSEQFEKFGRLLECWETGRLEESAALIDEADRRFPKHPAVELARAAQVLRQDNGRNAPQAMERAGAHALRAIELSQGAFAEIVIAGHTLADADRYDDVARIVEQLAEEADSGSHEDAHVAVFTCLRGRLADYRHDDEAAERWLREAFKTMGAHPDTESIAALTRFLHTRGRTDEARVLLSDAAAQWPQDLELRRLVIEIDGRHVLTLRPHERDLFFR